MEEASSKLRRRIVRPPALSVHQVGVLGGDGVGGCRVGARMRTWCDHPPYPFPLFTPPGIELRREGFFSVSPAPSSADPAAFMDSPLGFAAWKRSAGPTHLQALPTAMWRDQELPAGDSPDLPTPTMNSPPLTTDLSKEVAHFFSRKDGGGEVGGALVTPVGRSEEGRGMRGRGDDSWQEGGQWASELHGRGEWRSPEGEEACRNADGGRVGAGGINSWHSKMGPRVKKSKKQCEILKSELQNFFFFFFPSKCQAATWHYEAPSGVLDRSGRRPCSRLFARW